MKNAIIVLLISVLTLGCSADKSLELAESLMTELPDSSLAILREWKSNHQNPGRKGLARYSLLMSMALDKNYIDIQSDSIILPALKYYSGKDGREKMLTCYYHGLILRNSGSFSLAMVELEKAENEATKINDDFYLGLIFRNKANLFNETCDFPSAVKCARQSLNAFSRNRSDIYEQYARLSLAIALSNNKEYNEAIAVLDSIPNIERYGTLSYSSDLLRAQILMFENGPANEIIDLYRKVPKDFFDVLDYGRLSLAFEKTGQKDSANYWLERGYSLAPTKAYVASLNYQKSKIAHSRHQLEDAYQLLRLSTLFQDSITRVRLSGSLSAAQRDFFKQERDLQYEKTKVANARLILWILASVVLILLMTVFFHSHIKAQEARLRESLASLHSKDITINQLSNDNAQIIESVVVEKIRALESLSNRFCDADNEAQKDKILKEYKVELGKLQTNSAVFSDIEAALNKYRGGLIEKFRMQFPEIKGEKLNMAILFFTGVPYKKVDLFFKYHTVESLKQAKNRLRKTIQNSNAPDKFLFLDYLEMKKGGRRPSNPQKTLNLQN